MRRKAPAASRYRSGPTRRRPGRTGPGGSLLCAAVAVIFGALWLLSRPRTPTPRTFATLTLTAGAGDRAEGVQATKVKLPPDADALKIFLVLPDGVTPAARYRAELEG